jgi:DNA-binding beta-propeller fold protein YncE
MTDHKIYRRSTLAGAAFASLFCIAGAADISSVRAASPAATNAPKLAFAVDADFLKPPASVTLGEILGIAVSSKGRVIVVNHPGSAKTGPLYGNATTQVLEFDIHGNFVREIGEGVYGLGYAHAARFDRNDNLWIVDKGTDQALRFDDKGRVTLNIGRRAEGYDSNDHHRPRPPDAVAADGWFNGPTDIAWDPEDNIFISDGYVNSRIAKLSPWGDWITSWGSYGEGGEHADQNPGKFRNPHNMVSDKEGNLYVADRGNRRIHVFDKNGKFLRFLFLNLPYDKSRHPVLGNLPPLSQQPDETAPWTLCITGTSPQYLFAMDAEPGRLYKMTLDGRILGWFGESGRRPGQFNWPHALACPTDQEIYVADMNNWRVQKLSLRPVR